MYKVQFTRIPQTRFNLQGSTNKVLQTRTTFKHQSCYSPTSSQGRVLVQQASAMGYFTRFTINFFPYDSRNARKQENYYQWATYEDNFSTFPQPRILFWFTSSGFLKRLVLLKYWLLCPFFYKEATCKSSTKKGLFYAAKVVPSKDYFTHLTLKNARKGCWVISPKYHVTSTALLCRWGRSCSKIWRPLGLTLRCMPYGRGTLRNQLQRIL